MLRLLKNLPTEPTDECYSKALEVFNKLEVGESEIVTNIYIPLFACYLVSIRKLTKINGYHKTFTVRRLDDNSVSVYCNSTQSL